LTNPYIGIVSTDTDSIARKAAKEHYDLALEALEYALKKDSNETIIIYLLIIVRDLVVVNMFTLLSTHFADVHGKQRG